MGTIAKLIKSLDSRLGVDVPDELGYAEFVTDSQEMKILKEAEDECKKLSDEREWPLPNVKRRKAAKPSTEGNITTLNRNNEKTLEKERDER